MKQFIAFIRKEFYHIFRDKQTMLLLLAMPVVQILIFGFAITNEVKNSPIAVLDNSKDVMSQYITRRLNAGEYFNVVQVLNDQRELEHAFQRGDVKMVVVFPEKFEETLLHTGSVQVQMITDASDPNEANSITAYASSIIRDCQTELMSPGGSLLQIVPNVKMQYNPELKGTYNAVPGVMGLILMLVCAMMTSVAIVREKELGTMEVLLVSPLKPVYIILAKAVPYLVLSFINVLTIIALAVWVLGVPVSGSLALLLFVSLLFIITCLSLGLVISTFTDSQQAAMLISMMGLMVPTMLLSGMMFPIENMPGILQVVSNIVPAKWYIIMIKSVMIKGLGVGSVLFEMSVLTGMTLLLLLACAVRFKTRLE